jgi:hypothetical protein
MSELIEGESKVNAGLGLGSSINDVEHKSIVNEGNTSIVPTEPSARRMFDKKEEVDGHVLRSTSSPSLLPTSTIESARERVRLDCLPKLLESHSKVLPTPSIDANKTKRSAKNYRPYVQDKKEVVTLEAEQVHQHLEDKIMNTLDTSMQATKTESAAKTLGKARSQTVPGAISTAKPDPAEKKDLLGRFKTYNDQIIHSANTGSRKYKQLDQHSPKKEQLSQSKRTMKDDRKTKTNEPAGKECTVQNIDHFSHLKTPESQRAFGLSDGDDPPFVRGIGLSPLMLDIFRIFTILFSSASIASGACTAFDGKTSFIHSITDIPLMWIVRCYIVWFHLVLIVVELDIEIRGLIPKSTFGNFLHKGYLISFIGLLQSFPSSSMSLENVVSELQSGSLSVRSIQIRVAFAVLGICSKGLIACGIVYMLLGICGWNRESRRRAFKARHFSR